jgi:hypothetical protein
MGNLGKRLRCLYLPLRTKLFMYVLSAARQDVQNCQISTVDCQPLLLLHNVQILYFQYLTELTQSTAHQTIHFELCTAFISRALAPISNCECMARGAVDRTYVRIL